MSVKSTSTRFFSSTANRSATASAMSGMSSRSSAGSEAWFTNITVRAKTPASSKVARNRQ
jgi:hypothetical protein